MFPENRPLTAGIVLFEGFELLDVFGPLEFLGLLGKSARVTTVGVIPGPVASSSGTPAIIEATLDHSNGWDLLIIPGGIGTRRLVDNADFLGEIRRLAGLSALVASVCTGSALLAKAGILDGRRATSNKLAWDWVVSQGPRVQWVRRARWVEDGKFWTSSGISAGMDMTLAIIGSHIGEQAARDVARQAEYIWNSDPTEDPFAPADDHGPHAS